MNFIRQPLLPAFLTLTAVAATAIFSCGLVPAEGVEPSMLAGEVEKFSALYPGWARVVAFLSVLIAGLSLGRLTNRYNLYAGNCYLTMPVFGIIVCGVFPASASLTRYLVVLLLVWATYRFCTSLRNGYSFGQLFRASFITGLMPLLAAPAAGFILLVPIALLCFKRTAREGVVALFGLLFPIFALCYLTWALDGGFLTPLQTFAEAFVLPADGSPFVFDPIKVALPAYVLLLTLGALLIHAVNAYALSPKGRLMILFYLLLLPLVTVLWLLPSASVSMLTLIAVPSSVLLPLFFVRIRLFIGMLLYLFLLLLGFGGILFA